MAAIPTPEELDELKDRVIEYLKENELWFDCGIYVNGKRYCYDSGSPDEILIEDDIDVADYLEYYRREGNLFAMYFEGPLYEVINDYAPFDECERFYNEFTGLLEEYGLYYELGNAWNFSCYPI